MEWKFHKYQATGNDFVIFDGREPIPETSSSILSKLCDRRFGIGADGVVIVSDDEKLDFRVDYYNPDGSVSLCGNGTRAAIRFANTHGFTDKTSVKFMAYDGEHEAEILPDGNIRLKMANVQSVRFLEDGIFVDTGSPHLISFVDDVEAVNVFNLGRKLRYETPVEFGTNVNFVQRLNNSELKIRTYERGVECETLSCGTGVTASALAAALEGVESPVEINARGGKLKVEFCRELNDSFSEIFLIGPAEKVYSGFIEF